MKHSLRKWLVIPCLVLVFAVAVCIQSGVFAESEAAAQVGSASLTDNGDTVFIRSAIFTIDGKDYDCTGYTVGDFGTALNPTSNVDINVLTPITKENPLTGTLDKNIYICGSGTADMYLGNLSLQPGKTITAQSGTQANFLYGTLTADTINADIINFSGANATLRGDLEGFKQIDVGVQSTLNVGGSVKATAVSSVYSVGIHNQSEFNVGGDVDVPGWIHFSESSGTFSGNVHTGSYFAAVVGSTVEVKGNLDCDNWLDLSKVGSITVGGTTNCTGLSMGVDTGTTDGTAVFHGDVTASQFVCISGTKVEFMNDLIKTGTSDVFIFRNGADVTVGGSLTSGCYLDLADSKLTVVKDITVTNGNTYVKSSSLSVLGNLTTYSFNPQYLAKVDIDGNLTVTSGLNSSIVLTVNNGSDVTVGGDVDLNKTSLDVIHSLTTESGVDKTTFSVDGDIKNVYGLLNVQNQSSASARSIDVDGSVDLEGNSDLTIKNNANIVSSLIVHDNSTFTAAKIDSDVVDVRTASTLKCSGDETVKSSFAVSDALMSVGGNLSTLWFDTKAAGSDYLNTAVLTVGKTLTYNSRNGRISNVSVKGDLINKDATVGTMDGLLVVGNLTVDGNILMPESFLNIDTDNGGSLNVSDNTNIQALRLVTLTGLEPSTKYTSALRDETYKTDSDGVVGFEVPFGVNSFGITDAASNGFYASPLNFCNGVYAAKSGALLQSVTLSSATPEIGSTLTASVTPAQAAVALQWYRIDENGNPTAITGATESTYTVTQADAGHALKCSASSADGSYFSEPSATTEALPKISGTITLGDGESVTYNGSKAIYPADKINKKDTADAVTFSYQPTAELTVPDDAKWLEGMPTEAGTYFIIATATGDSTYNTVTSAPVTFEVKPFETEVNWPEQTYTYNGSVQTIKATYSDVSGSTIDAVVTTDAEFCEPGTYTAKAEMATADSNYLLKNAEKTYKMNKLTCDIYAVYDKNESVSSCGALPEISYTGKQSGKISWDAYKLGSEGTYTFGWTFVPDDSAHYETATGTASFTVSAHNWSEWKSDNNAGLFRNATESRQCDCGETETRTVKNSSEFAVFFIRIFNTVKSFFTLVFGK